MLAGDVYGGAVIPNRTPRIVAAFRGGVGATLQGQQASALSFSFSVSTFGAISEVDVVSIIAAYRMVRFSILGVSFLERSRLARRPDAKSG